MGFRRITFLLAIMFAMSLAACGDNKKKVFDDAGVVDMPMVDGDMEDAPPDAGCPVGQMLCGTSCVDTLKDSLAESDETVMVEIRGGGNISLGSPASATGTIQDPAPLNTTMSPRAIGRKS